MVVATPTANWRDAAPRLLEVLGCFYLCSFERIEMFSAIQQTRSDSSRPEAVH